MTWGGGGGGGERGRGQGESAVGTVVWVAWVAKATSNQMTMKQRNQKVTKIGKHLASPDICGGSSLTVEPHW